MLDFKFSYRGIGWNNDRELSRKLNRGDSYVREKRIIGKTYEEIIDGVLDKQYRGISWYSDSDLSKQLGKSDPYVKRHIAHGESREQIIDYILDNKK